jgi:hypothetical protein
VLLPGIATTPDNHGESEQDAKGNLSTDTAADTLDIQKRTDNESSDNLGKPVQETVQGLGAGVEVGTVDTVLLVGVEPVGGPEHGEEQDDVGLGLDGLPQTVDLGPPAGALHQNDAGAILTDDLVGIANEQGQAGTEEHEHNEGDVGAVTDGAVGLDVDVLSEGDLL